MITRSRQCVSLHVNVMFKASVDIPGSSFYIKTSSLIKINSSHYYSGQQHISAIRIIKMSEESSVPDIYRRQHFKNQAFKPAFP